MKNACDRTTTISCGWWGYILSIAIIAIRAFQPNAEPMSEWSMASWIAMLTPILWPFWLCGFLWILGGLCGLAAWFLRKF